jgi:hypothetical protein
MKAYKCTQHCLGCPSGASHSHNIIHNSVCTQKILFSSSSIFLFLQEMSLNVLLRSIDRWAGGSSSTVPQSVRYHKLLLPRALDVCNRPGQAKWRAGSHVYVWYETFLMSFCNPTTSLWRQTLFVNKTWPVRCTLRSVRVVCCHEADFSASELKFPIVIGKGNGLEKLL